MYPGCLRKTKKKIQKYVGITSRSKNSGEMGEKIKRVAEDNPIISYASVIQTGGILIDRIQLLRRPLCLARGG